MLQVYEQDEDGNYNLGDLSHLGAVSGVNFEEITHGFLYRQVGSANARRLITITPERYVGLERRLRPHKQRDEGERRLGCPREPTTGIKTLLNRRSVES